MFCCKTRPAAEEHPPSSTKVDATSHDRDALGRVFDGRRKNRSRVLPQSSLTVFQPFMKPAPSRREPFSLSHCTTRFPDM